MEKPKEEKESKGYVEGREKVITEVELRENIHNPEAVDKVIFHSTTGDITWKPKVIKVSYEGGFKVSKRVSMEKPFLPEIVKEIAMAANEKGQVKVLTDYNYWETTKDGQPVTYRFLNSEKTLEKWKIIPEEVKEEEVKEKP